jgi:hypothetical protein
MAIANLEHWYLKKHDHGEIFGPVHFDKVREWATSAQINPQDMLSEDKVVWTKAPMIPELEMDWLVVVGENLLYGPTTSGALLEFVQLGEITPETHVVNCCSGEIFLLSDTPFYAAAQAEPREEMLPSNPLLARLQQSGPGSIKFNLQKRVRELETALLEKRRKLLAAEESIARLETKVRELELQVRELSGFRKR